MRDTNIKLIRVEFGHYAHKAARIIARHALERWDPNSDTPGVAPASPPLSGLVLISLADSLSAIYH
jgi:hypothetical protein